MATLPLLATEAIADAAVDANDIILPYNTHELYHRRKEEDAVERPNLLREWSYSQVPPAPSEPPVAVVVDPTPSDPPRPVCTFSTEEGLPVEGTANNGEGQYPVATFVSNLADNLRSSFHEMYTSSAENAENVTNDDDASAASARVIGGAWIARVVSSIPANGSVVPHSADLAPGDGTNTVDGLIVPPPNAPSATPIEDDWVFDAYEEAEFHVINGQLVEVTVPADEEDDELRPTRGWFGGRGRGSRIRRESGSKGKRCVGSGVAGVVGVGEGARAALEDVAELSGGMSKKTFGQRLRKFLKKRKDRRRSDKDIPGEIFDPLELSEDVDGLGAHCSGVAVYSPPASPLHEQDSEGSSRRRRRSLVRRRGGRKGRGRSPSVFSSHTAVVPCPVPQVARVVGEHDLSLFAVKAPQSMAISSSERVAEARTSELSGVVEKISESDSHVVGDVGDSATVPSLALFVEDEKKEVVEVQVEVAPDVPGSGEVASLVAVRSPSLDVKVAEGTALPEFVLSLEKPKDVLMEGPTVSVELPKEPSPQAVQQSVAEEEMRTSPTTVADTETVVAKADSEDINNKLKVVVLGGPLVDKSAIMRQLSAKKSSSKKGKSERKKTVGVDVRSWDPSKDGDQEVKTDVTFSLWDCPGGNASDGSHHSTHSMFFSSDTVYVLVWDMASKDPKTFRAQPSQRVRISSDDTDTSSSSEDEGVELYSKEFYDLKADRALDRDIDENMLYWLDCILESKVDGGAIIPVASVEDDVFDAAEARRRLEVLRGRLQNHFESVKNKYNHLLPRLILETSCGAQRSEGGITMINGGRSSGLIPLQNILKSVAANKSIFAHHLGVEMPVVTTELRKIIKKVKKTRKIVPVELLVSHLLDVVSSVALDEVRSGLRFLSATGEILYFDSDDDATRSRYVVLSPKWMGWAMECVLRSELRHEVAETRTVMNSQAYDADPPYPEDHAFAYLSGRSNCPLIASGDVDMLWLSRKHMRDEASMNGLNHEDGRELWGFLKDVFVSNGVFLPMDLISSASVESQLAPVSSIYMLPGLLEGDGTPWSFKCRDSSKITLCDSWLVPRTRSSSLMENLIPSVLKELYTYTNLSGSPLCLHSLRCWKSGFLASVGMHYFDPESGGMKESLVDIFSQVLSKDSPVCVAATSMDNQSLRLVVSAKGRGVNAGRKIWAGGYELVTSTVEKVVAENGCSCSRDIVCPDCLGSGEPGAASTWPRNYVQECVTNGHKQIMCRSGHVVDLDTVCGLCMNAAAVPDIRVANAVIDCPPVSVKSLLAGVVLVGLWDAQEKRVVNIGSGFIANRDLGLIVTAGHIMYDVQGAKRFGKDYYGLRNAKAVIGVIPKKTGKDNSSTAVFRYFAEIVAKDVKNVDACVLRITTRFEEDVVGEDCSSQPEIPLMNDSKAIRAEKLQPLELARHCELEEKVRIIGFNQGGEGLFTPGQYVNRSPDVASGYVCKKHEPLSSSRSADADGNGNEGKGKARLFVPRKELVVNDCWTIGGHSGGPCVNQDGKVIGILSRADSDGPRCYLVPSSEIKRLVSTAKWKCSLSPLDLYNLE